MPTCYFQIQTTICESPDQRDPQWWSKDSWCTNPHRNWPTAHRSSSTQGFSLDLQDLLTHVTWFMGNNWQFQYPLQADVSKPQPKMSAPKYCFLERDGTAWQKLCFGKRNVSVDVRQPSPLECAKFEGWSGHSMKFMWTSELHLLIIIWLNKLTL